MQERGDAFFLRKIARSLAEAVVAGEMGVPADCPLATSLIEAAVSNVLRSGYGICPDGTYDVANIAEAARAYLCATADEHHLELAVFESDDLRSAAVAMRYLRKNGDWAELTLEDAALVLLSQIKAASEVGQDVREALSRCQTCLRTVLLGHEGCSCPAIGAPWRRG